MTKFLRTTNQRKIMYSDQNRDVYRAVHNSNFTSKFDKYLSVKA